MATPDVQILAPTLFEWWMVRRLPGAVYAGLGLRRWDGTGDVVIVVGVAGALTNLPPGTIIVPAFAATEDGRRVECDRSLQETLAVAARDKGYRVDRGPLLTARAMVIGEERSVWARRGFAAADMETALVAGGQRVGALRIILDSPQKEISGDWTGPRAALRPSLWPELAGMALSAPRHMRRLKRVLETALGEPSCSPAL